MFALLRGRGGVVGFTVSASRTGVVLVLGDQLRLNPDVVVGEFAHLGIVDTNNLGFFVATKTEERNVVHDPQNNGLRKSMGRSDDLTQAGARNRLTVMTKE